MLGVSPDLNLRIEAITCPASKAYLCRTLTSPGIRSQHLCPWDTHWVFRRSALAVNPRRSSSGGLASAVGAFNLRSAQCGLYPLVSSEKGENKLLVSSGNETPDSDLRAPKLFAEGHSGFEINDQVLGLWARTRICQDQMGLLRVFSVHGSLGHTQPPPVPLYRLSGRGKGIPLAPTEAFPGSSHDHICASRRTIH